MKEALLDAFRHDAWATKTLIAACRGVPDEKLAAPRPTRGFGSVLATFNHLILADAAYLSALAGNGPAWAGDGDETADLDELEARAEETARLWEQFLARPLDGERLLILDNGTYETHAGVLVAQALHHASVHREQICAILAGFGIPPPDLQAWAYANAAGRCRVRQKDGSRRPEPEGAT